MLSIIKRILRLSGKYRFRVIAGLIFNALKDVYKRQLLNMIGGLDRPTSGSVTIRGKELLKMKMCIRDRQKRCFIGNFFQKHTGMYVQTASGSK